MLKITAAWVGRPGSSVTIAVAMSVTGPAELAVESGRRRLFPDSGGRGQWDPDSGGRGHWDPGSGVLGRWDPESGVRRQWVEGSGVLERWSPVSSSRLHWCQESCGQGRWPFMLGWIGEIHLTAHIDLQPLMGENLIDRRSLLRRLFEQARDEVDTL